MNTATLNTHDYCIYYQAHIVRPQVWFFVAILRSFDHVTFDRTYDVAESVFEFFIPAGMEPYFLEIMHSLQKEGVVSTLIKKPNRLFDAAQQV
ncbi:MAG: hypothetical protein NT124_01075 [Candidatus Dependentiae bacterium]|nr:hypothetical protein [Candidatus Dependentiae bacterium]